MSSMKPVPLLIAVGLFAALPPARAVEPLTLLAIGDTGDCAQDGARLVGAAMRELPDWRQAWLIEAGDLAYPQATRARLAECHEPHFAAFPHRLAVPGNHDLVDGSESGFRAFFPAVPRAVRLNETWTVLLLDSNLRAASARRQLAWLDDQVRQRGKRCLVAVWHHPRWSAGWHGDDEHQGELWRRLAGVATLTVHGHDHHFEAVPPLDADGHADAAGTRSFVVGNGGAALYPAVRNRHASEVVSGHWGFLRIDIEGRHYTWREVGIDGNTLVSGDGDCRQP